MQQRGDTASPTLTQDQINFLRRYGETTKTEAGQVLIRAGDSSSDSFVARKRGKVLAIAREQLKKVVTEDPPLSDIILTAFLARRSIGMRAGVA
jgi:hypothetical protein